MLKLPKLNIMKQCGLAVFGLGAFLMICGWFIAFVSLCYGQSESYFDRFDYSPVSYTHLTLPTNREV